MPVGKWCDGDICTTCAEEALRANMLEGKPADNDFDLFTADGPLGDNNDHSETDDSDNSDKNK